MFYPPHLRTVIAYVHLPCYQVGPTHDTLHRNTLRNCCLYAPEETAALTITISEITQVALTSADHTREVMFVGLVSAYAVMLVCIHALPLPGIANSLAA